MGAPHIVVHTTVHTADLATTILAALGVVLALVSLGWQAVSFWLSGSRVRVEIRAGATDGVRVASVSGSPTQDQQALLQRQGLTQLILGVKVKNLGRAPTSVTSVDLHYSNGAGLSGAYLRGSPELPCRMEGETEQTWYFDADLAARFARVFEEAKKTGKPQSVSARGLVRVGGKTKPVISKNNIRIF